ncbi:MAG: sulfatase, partial [Candidatus Hydrogenedentota bacterium]
MASVSARKYLAIVTIIIVCGCNQQTSDESQTAVSQPDQPMNCLYIVLDAFRASKSSLYGYPESTTPYLEKWSKQGVVFENVTSQFTSTTGSSWSYLNGLYPYRTSSFYPMREIDVPMAELFKKAGYRTGGFSDNPFITETQRTNKGFTHFEYHKFDEPVLDESNKLVKNPGKPERSKFLFGRLEQWIQNDEPGPWFAYCHTLRPHNPYAVPEPYLSRFADTSIVPDGEDNQDFFVAYEKEFFPRLFVERWTPANIDQLAILHRVYLSGLAYIDSLVDTLLTSLKNAGQLDNTFIIITSDHGEGFGEHKRVLHGGPPHREQNHVPLIVIPPPGMNIEPARASTPIELIDILPTLNEIFELNDANVRHGQSLKPLLMNHEGYESKAIFSQSPEELAVILDEYKLILKIQLGDKLAERQNNNASEPKASADNRSPIDPDKFKHIVKYQNDKKKESLPPRLYNIRDDPDEINNLYPKPQIVSKLFALAIQYLNIQSG